MVNATKQIADEVEKLLKIMNLNNIHNVYFIGIGGIGMSALARYFHVNKKNVAGYDKTKTEITDSLEHLGVMIHFEDSVANIPIQIFKF